MPVRVQLTIVEGAAAIAPATTRYDLLGRFAASAAARDVRVLAFGLGDDRLRFVLDGADDAIDAVLHGFRSATSRQARRQATDIVWARTRREAVTEAGITAAAVWAHASVPGEPLATPWTSHRDLLGYRRAPFFDAEAARARVDVSALPGATAPSAVARGFPAPPLATVLRLAAAVRGVLPADRTCFRLFVHLGRALGYGTDDLARALALTARRIRQLAAEVEPMLHPALASFGDARLAALP